MRIPLLATFLLTPLVLGAQAIAPHLIGFGSGLQEKSVLLFARNHSVIYRDSVVKVQPDTITIFRRQVGQTVSRSYTVTKYIRDAGGITFIDDADTLRLLPSSLKFDRPWVARRAPRTELTAVRYRDVSTMALTTTAVELETGQGSGSGRIWFSPAYGIVLLRDPATTIELIAISGHRLVVRDTVVRVQRDTVTQTRFVRRSATLDASWHFGVGYAVSAPWSDVTQTDTSIDTGVSGEIIWGRRVALRARAWWPRPPAAGRTRPSPGALLDLMLRLPLGDANLVTGSVGHGALIPVEEGGAPVRQLSAATVGLELGFGRRLSLVGETQWGLLHPAAGSGGTRTMSPPSVRGGMRLHW